MKIRDKNRLINVVTLGCSKNLVDSEVLLNQIKANGARVLHDADITEAEIVVINTCGFINDAKEESIDTILRFIQAKKQGRIKKLYVMGCLSQRYKNDLIDTIPEVDYYFGVNDLKNIIETLGFNFKEHLIGERFITTPSHYAYLKISEGCNRKCSFCAIPAIRGKYRSKPIEEIIHEAKNLIDIGVKEIILIAQDLTYYGIDLYKKQQLAELLDRLTELEGMEWLRLHYAYPAEFPLEILSIIRERKNICNYLDIPFQHISDPVLKMMRRGVTSSDTYMLINEMRNAIPGLTLRTTLMTGHPGEGLKEFKDLLEFVEKMKFDRLGVFAYSEEEGTYGARTYKDTITENEKQKRVGEIMEIQAEISMSLNHNKIGKEFRVIIDRKENEYWIGRTEGDSPEVDNEVLITSDRSLKVGNFYTVKVVDAEQHDLFALI